MDEADLMYHLILVKDQLENGFAQLITLTLALLVGTYYFLHRAGLLMKLGVFAVYLIGWWVFAASQNVTGIHWQSLSAELRELVQAGEAGSSSAALVELMNTGMFRVYVSTLIFANYVLLVGSFLFLFFWRHPDHISNKQQSAESSDGEADTDNITNS